MMSGNGIRVMEKRNWGQCDRGKEGGWWSEKASEEVMLERV